MQPSVGLASSAIGRKIGFNAAYDLRGRSEWMTA
jgi:hypothetical protein